MYDMYDMFEGSVFDYMCRLSRAAAMIEIKYLQHSYRRLCADQNTRVDA